MNHEELTAERTIRLARVELGACYQRIDEMEYVLRLARKELDDCWHSFVAFGKHKQAEWIEGRISLIDRALGSEVV